MKRRGMLVIVNRPGRGPEIELTLLADVFSLTAATSKARGVCASDVGVRVPVPTTINPSTISKRMGLARLHR
jgi:hypothetical protein